MVSRLTRSKLIYLALAVTFVVAPLVETLLLFGGLFAATIGDYVPATDDEMYLWRQEATFAAAGFNGGYYTFEEYPARLAFSHYGPHGFVVPLLYGSIGRLVGWQPYTAIVLNMILIAAALAIFVYLRRPTTKQLALLTLFIATFWPLLWQLPANLQEALHQSLAIVLAAVISPWLARPAPLSRRTAILFLLAVLVIALTRQLWALLLFPLALAGLFPGGRPLALLIAAGSTILALASLILAGSPYPNFISDFLSLLDTPRTAAALFFDHLLNNLGQFFTLADRNPLMPLERYQVLLLLLAISGGLLLSLWRGRPRLAGLAAWAKLAPWANSNRPDLFHVANLGVMIATLILFYIAGGDQSFRTLAPYLLMTALLLILGRRYQLVGLLIFTNLLATPFFLQEYNRVKIRNVSFEAEPVAAFQEATQPYLAYDPDLGPWANTLLLDGNLLCYDVRCDYLTAVPAGLGTSYIFFPERLQAPLKSQYLLLGEKGLQQLNRHLGPQLNLQLLTTTPYGDLYLNLDCACD